MYKGMKVFLSFYFPLFSSYLISFPFLETLNSFWETFEKAMASSIWYVTKPLNTQVLV